MQIRNYMDTDEEQWLRCRVVSFLDCSYWNDVKTKKEKYGKPCISLVAENNGVIIGLIDIELDSADLFCTDKGHGAILWHLAVLPEFRKAGVAKKLWIRAKAKLQADGVQYCEVWTQEDFAANAFYQSIGFELENEATWIRCYTKGTKCSNFLDQTAIGNIYGPEELVFDAPISRKKEFENLCYRIDEVRLYSGLL